MINLKQPVAQCLHCWAEFFEYEDLIDHGENCVPEPITCTDVTGRALEIADTVCDMIWGGERGWEIATKSQYKALLRILRTRLKTHPEA